VGIDGRSLAGEGPGRGVAHYTSALLGALAERWPDDEWHVLIAGATPASAPAASNVFVHRTRGSSRLVHAASATLRRPRLDRLLDTAPDVFWAPSAAPLAISREVPLVLTVHDLSWEQRPGDFTAYEHLFHRVARPRALARRAARVMTDTDATRTAAVGAWGLEPDRVAVVPCGVAPRAESSADEVDAARLRCGLPSRFLLFVGALEPRKAPDALVRAFARARSAGLDADLAIVGEGRLGPSLAGPGVHLLGTVDHPTRDALYSGALALVLPSLLEGFGFPPLEALSAGTAPVVTDLAVYDETLGEGALRVKPGDDHALSDALLRIAADPELRAELVRRGRASIAALTWERAAEEARGVLAAAAGVP
jgi:glycosyltransferase involved in cell wall biosynthesis